MQRNIVASFELLVLSFELRMGREQNTGVRIQKGKIIRESGYQEVVVR